VKNEKTTLTGGANYFTRRAGQFIFSKIDLLNGAFGIVPDSLDGFSSSSDVPAYAFSGEHSSAFFLNWLKANYERLDIERTGTSSTLKRVSPEKFLALSLSAPSWPEQQKIADCLTSLDELIAAERRKVEALKAHKKGLTKKLFPREGETLPRLRFPEFRDEGEWNTVSLNEVLEVASGQVDPTQPPYCDLPHVGGENIESHTGNLGGLKTARELRLISGKYLFDQRDVLYSKIRPALNKVALSDFNGTCSADIYPLRPLNRVLRREYLFYLLLSDEFLEYATKHSSRSKIPKINRDSLLSYRAPIPARAEQQRIADCLSALDARIAAEADKLAALKTHKKGLMQQLFPSPEGD
jgi:type I restriction enzyme S subunit